MVLYDPDKRWQLDCPELPCMDPKRRKFFHAPGPGDPNRAPGPATQGVWDRAKVYCTYCPVMHQCRRDSFGETSGVFGGLDEHQRAQVRRELPRAAQRWPSARRMAWAKEMHRLRTEGRTYETILRRTGLNRELAHQLFREYERHLARVEAKKAGVVHLPEPKARPKRAFPKKPGKKHAWARDGNVFLDGHYKAQTSDGQWLLLQVTGSKGHVQKWYQADDVQLYYPQPVVLKERYERATEKAA